MKKITSIFLMTLLSSCGGSESSLNSLSDISHDLSSIISGATSAHESAGISEATSVLESSTTSEAISVLESTSSSENGTTSQGTSLADSSTGTSTSTHEENPLYPSNTYYYDFTTFNKVVNYKSGSEDFGQTGFNWTFSSYQNQGAKFYLGSNGRFANSELFGLTEENGFLPLLGPSTYEETDITYGMKMDFDISGVNGFGLAWDNRSAEVDMKILYSTDSGATWILGHGETYTGMVPTTGYTLPGSILFSSVFASRVRFAVICKALSTTGDGGSTLNLARVSIV